MRILRILVLSLLVIGVSIALAQFAVAQTFTTLHSFNGTDGSEPHAGLVQDVAGNLYGTTWGGGASDAGTVFKLDRTGKEVVLHSFSFNPADGANPNAGLVRDDAGNLYGTTAYLGAYYNGTVFKLDRTGKETVLHSFNGADGAYPYADLIRDDAGNLYGTTAGGGASGAGTVFKLHRTGKETVLYSFTGFADGAYPYAGLVRDDAGNLYGTTSLGGTRSVGTVFKLDTAGKETVLHSFTGGADGAYPNAGLVRDDTGNLYGTTSGLNSAGTVFKLDAAGTLTVYPFTGSNPRAGLIRDDAGNLYGTAVAGGPSDRGTVFKLDATGTETVLYRFTGGADGAHPYAGLVRDDAGNLYGTTSSGGANSVGTVFKIAQVKPLQPLTCFSLIDLGDFYLNVYESLGLNAKGSVVGTTLRWGQPYQGFEYEKGRFLRLPTLGGDSADPRQINERGQIIGQSQLPNGLWHATMWDRGRPIDLGTLGGGSSFAGSLNDRGDAAGNSAVLSLYDFHAAAWFKGKPVNLTLDGEIQSYANGINNRGQVTGITNYQDGTWHSFIWEDGARTELPRPSGDVFSSFINNAGTVCGGANFPGGYHAFTYHGTDLVDLDPTSVWWWNSCNGLNDYGHAVGTFGGPLGNRGFLWRNAGEGMIDLNSRISPDSRTSLFTADNINEADQITAPGYVDGQLHGFLLTPKACSVRCARAPSNLIAWWPGDGNATDIVSGVNGVTMGAGYAPAAVNKGFTFDGVDDYVDVPNPVSLPEISTAVTVAAWVNPQKPTPPAGEGDSEGWVFALRDPMISEGVSISLTSGGGLWAILQADNPVWSGSWNPVIKYDGSWKHVALTADTTTGRVTLFLNGVAVQDEYPGLTGQFVHAQHLYIGQRERSDTDEGPDWAMHYRGLIDEVQLFNRALAPSEILAIYQAGPKGVCKRTTFTVTP